MYGVFDDPDPLMLDQEDYEAAEAAESYGPESSGHSDWDTLIRDQEDYEAAQYAEKLGSGGPGRSGGSGGCGNCIMYAFGAAAIVLVLGHLVSACS